MKSVFAVMTALARRTGALNLGQGFPDSDGPDFLLDAARRAIGEGLNQYPPVNGLPRLRQAISEQREAEYGLRYDPDSEIVVTMGATEAVAAALPALCDTGDEVIVFEPYYDAYGAAISLAGGVRRTVLLQRDGDRFVFDPDELRGAVTSRTRVILLNSPHNPTGKVFGLRELEQIAEVCREHDLIAVTDEVYEYLTYDGVRHITLASLPGMRERTLAISSAGKTFNVTGWKVGWACGPARLVDALVSVKQYLTFAGGGPFQAAVAEGLRNPRPWVDTLRDDLQGRRDTLLTGLAAAGIRTWTPEGTYFLQADAASFGHHDGEELCHVLAERAGVVLLPSTAFFDDKEAGRPLLRLAFCKRRQTLDTAVERLTAFALARPQETQA
ncbi:pyridoxal phosphate-dependent aminotransferase [Streptomyces sp. DT24]|uniref:pyridoxal phosphate-dependent aminotransferase n=1 Tax=Streptomyces sp. DT24 TaxID=3416520 RepID=UPI003CF54FB8